MSEEEIMLSQNDEYDDYVSSFPDIPYFLIEDEVGSARKTFYVQEFNEIRKYYKVYKKGSKFIAEGSNSDYVPSALRYKKAAMIMNKEARFLFSNSPSFNINVDNVSGENEEENAILQSFLDKVLEKTKFNGKLLKGLKDCFIGKRIAIVLNFNESSGITITFLKSTEFIYEIDEQDDTQLKKLVTFCEKTGTSFLQEQRWYKKVYEKINEDVFIEENIFDGTGELLETVTKRRKIKFNYIPAVIVLNDGLTGEINGESELLSLKDYERYYSKMANADMDAERKSMNPIRYTIDASQDSTKILSTSPGSYWDLQTEDDKPNENLAAKVGTLEAQMTYSSPLKTTLDRLENEMYAEVDVPNINSEQIAGVITSGKTIQALYWGLTVRCDEKMLSWGPELSSMAYMIIEGGILYPKCIRKYTDVDKLPVIPFDVKVENNYPIPEDVMEEKNMDINEVEANVMSRKAYIKKWRGLNDAEAEDEILQIIKEKNMIDDSYLNHGNGNSTVDVEDEESEEQDFEDDEEE